MGHDDDDDDDDDRDDDDSDDDDDDRDDDDGDDDDDDDDDHGSWVMMIMTSMMMSIARGDIDSSYSGDPPVSSAYASAESIYLPFCRMVPLLVFEIPVQCYIWRNASPLIFVHI